MASYSRTAQQWATFARVWYVIDAKMQPPGKIASLCAAHLTGKHKPMYHATSDCGDHVVVINTRHIAFSGNKWEQKVYSSHSGDYPKDDLLQCLLIFVLGVCDGTLVPHVLHKIMKLAIYGMLPKNLQRRTMMQRLHLFSENNIPEEIKKNLTAEIQQPRNIPKRLDEYSQEEIDAFPRLWSPPPDFIPK